jgi:hypothetical protein
MPAEHVLVVGGRQARALQRVIGAAASEAGPAVTFMANRPNARAGREPEFVVRRLSRADVVVFQNQSPGLDALSLERVRAGTDGPVITVPLIGNPAVAGLCATGGAGGPGRVHGAEPVLELLQGGMAVDAVLAAYRAGEIDFDLPARFASAVRAMRRRDLESDVLLGEQVMERNRELRLFLSHRDPATALLAEICGQVSELAGLGLDVEALRAEDPGFAGLESVDDCPISPHDAGALGYEFEPDPDWAERGAALITQLAARTRAQ